MNQKNENPIIIYEDADHAIEVRLDARQDTVWLRQEQMSQLFGRERSVITKHLRNVFTEGELDADSVLLVPTLPRGNAYVKVRYEFPRRTVGTRKNELKQSFLQKAFSGELTAEAGKFMDKAVA